MTKKLSGIVCPQTHNLLRLVIVFTPQQRKKRNKNHPNLKVKKNTRAATYENLSPIKPHTHNLIPRGVCVVDKWQKFSLACERWAQWQHPQFQKFFLTHHHWYGSPYAMFFTANEIFIKFSISSIVLSDVSSLVGPTEVAPLWKIHADADDGRCPFSCSYAIMRPWRRRRQISHVAHVMRFSRARAKGRWTFAEKGWKKQPPCLEFERHNTQDTWQVHWVWVICPRWFARGTLLMNVVMAMCIRCVRFRRKTKFQWHARNVIDLFEEIQLVNE